MFSSIVCNIADCTRLNREQLDSELRRQHRELSSLNQKLLAFNCAVCFLKLECSFFIFVSQVLEVINIKFLLILKQF